MRKETKAGSRPHLSSLLLLKVSNKLGRHTVGGYAVLGDTQRGVEQDERLQSFHLPELSRLTPSLDLLLLSRIPLIEVSDLHRCTYPTLG